MKRIIEHVLWMYSLSDQPKLRKEAASWRVPSRIMRTKALALLAVMLIDTIAPLTSYALTGGPSQPEVQSFEPVGTTEMVDLFSGDFNYNIPLLDVNGYPINIAYHAGVSADQEASWVGLGWNINPGTVNRNLRGLPDDMNGEEIEKELHVKDNWTVGIVGKVGIELFGADAAKAASKENLQLSLNLGIQYNSYKGVSTSTGVGLSWSKGQKEKNGGLTGGLNLNYSDAGGLDISPDVGITYSKKIDQTNSTGGSFGVGTVFNSRAGLKSMNVNGGVGNSTSYGDESYSSGTSTQALFNFSAANYSPGISMPFKSANVGFNFRMGLEIYGCQGYAGLSGSFSNQYLAAESYDKQAYGYLYEDQAYISNTMSSRNYLLDFYRENDGAVSRYTPFLPWTNHTFDIYSVAAQGVGGTYRLHRNDIPFLHDDYNYQNSGGGTAGVDFGAGGLLKGGGNGGFNLAEYKGGAWLRNDGNKLVDRIGFVGSAYHANEVPLYEPAYFKNQNEINGQNERYLDLVGGESLVYPKQSGHEMMSTLKMGHDEDLNLKSNYKENVSKERSPRNQLFSYVTAGNAKYCFNEKIEKYGLNSDFEVSPELLDRNRFNPHHISEVSIVNNDGSRHIFGIPAYNTNQIEKSFRVEAAYTLNEAKGLVEYSTEEGKADNSLNNSKGIDEYYSKVKTPAYVHSYLLTSVLSPDYIDLTGDGITDDDLGSAVKINYAMVNHDYHWRVPVELNHAKYSKGFDSDASDDIGHYVYGQKEIWHVHSIEGKTHVALFKVSERVDGRGVVAEDGGLSSEHKMFRLDSILLYSKQELRQRGASADPIKVVHFEYSYELCEGIPNNVNGEGKLTLDKIYFTYRDSRKGKHNAYQFDYKKHEGHKYHLNGYDGWGTYNLPQLEDNNQSGNAAYPFTSQDKDSADLYASLWNLNKITLPSGGVIHIEYEADDYAYVQDKRAMNMFKIKGIGRHGSEGQLIMSDELYTQNFIQNDIVFFELKESLTGTEDENLEVLRNEYLGNLNSGKDKWIQITVNTAIEGRPADSYEYIKAYAEPKLIGSEIECGVTASGTVGWFKIKKVSIRDKGGQPISPIARAAFQYARINLPHLIHPRSNTKKADNADKVSMALLGPLIGMMEEFATMAMGQNRMMMAKGSCRKVRLNKSWVRLCTPDKVKYGGGHRVKKIVLNDNWEEMNSTDPNAENSTYGQEYVYNLLEKNDKNGESRYISSGVACNEPTIIKNENPLTQPFFMDEKNVGAPDVKYMFEYPVMEGHMPGASVGYSRIEVKSLSHENQAKHHQTGSEVTQFYTAKDFPVKTEVSLINGEFDKPWHRGFFGVGENHEQVTATQGYKIVLNDMHGKMRSQESFDAFGKSISGVEYEYQLTNGELDNTVLAVSSKGEVYEKELGVSVDLNVDTRYKMDRYLSHHFDFNLDVMMLFSIPLTIPMVWPSVNRSKTTIKTAVTNKVVRKIGLLKKTTAKKEGSEIRTENLLYDGKTGNVLLTSIENEFGDTIYNFTYPAHWAYDEGMGMAFENWGLELKDLKNTSSGIESNYDLDKYLCEGDLCYIHFEKGDYSRDANALAHVYKGSSGEVQLISASFRGKGINLNKIFDDRTFSLRILRSGRKNMAGIEIGSVTTTVNPLVSTGGEDYELSFSNVLSTSAVEYSDRWKTDMSFVNEVVCDTNKTSFYYATLQMLDTLIERGYFEYDYYYSFERKCEDKEIEYKEDPIGEFVSRSNDVEFHYNKLGIKPHRKSLVWEGDSSSATIHCSTKGSDSIFRYDWVAKEYYKVNGLLIYKSGVDKYYDTIKLQMGDTLYVRNGAEMIPIVDRTFLNNLEMGENIEEYYATYPIVEYWKKHLTRFSRNNRKEIIYTSEPFTDSLTFGIGSVDSTSCVIKEVGIPPSPVQRRLYAWFDGLTDYKIRLIRTEYYCDCYFNINTHGFMARDIEKILSAEPIEDNELLIVAQVETHYGLTDTIEMNLTTNCGVFTECDYNCLTAFETRKVDPYQLGIRGNWRPSKSWTYVDDRAYNVSSASPRTDGEFEAYDDFWKYHGGEKRYKPYGDGDWVWSAEVTEYSPLGMELENKDALGRYSAAIYGYSRTLPKAVGSNAQHRQLWFENFEEYKYMYHYAGNFICPQSQYPFEGDDDINNNGYIASYSHTGEYALQPQGDSLIQEILLNPEYIDTISSDDFPDEEYIAGEEDHLVRFRPTPGKYLVSAWVAEVTPEIEAVKDTVYSKPIVRIEVENGASGTEYYKLKPASLVIDGWQKVEAIINVTEESQLMRIKYVATPSDTFCVFDDLRIHPYNGNMKSYVYQINTLRLMAELDENNFATIYEYDREGNLVRIKKETEKGIVTLQENRKHLKPNSNTE